MKNDMLPEFQEFLRSRRLVNEKYISFNAYPARKNRAEMPEGYVAKKDKGII
jgi:hypothetical protein